MNDLLKMMPKKESRGKRVRVQGMVDGDTHARVLKILKAHHWSINDLITVAFRSVLTKGKI